MNILVGIISPIAAWALPPSFVDQLRQEFPQHRFIDAWDRAAIRRGLVDADVAFTPFVDPDVLVEARRLRWVQSSAAGVGSMLVPQMVASPIVITTAGGIRARSMAEHVLGVALALARQFPAALRYQGSHHWAQDDLDTGAGPIRTLHGCRMGIVGVGAIGTEVARLSAAFGLRVSAIRRHPERPLPTGVEDVLPPDRLPELLAKSDVVVLAAPLTADTRGLIGRRELAVIKRGAYLINVSRGKLLDDDAVVLALRDGQLGGAALDVFLHEPLDPASPYWDLPNVIVTPHVSGAMPDYWVQLVALFSENLRRFESGQPLLNVVDKTLGY